MIDLSMQPLRFEPFFRPMVWGGRRIGSFLGKNLPADVPYGESWEVSDHAVHRSRLATASLYHVTLRTLMQEKRAELLGPAAERYTSFPWLIKLLDANDWLSVQVHPDEEAVKKLSPGECAKTEAWFILDARPQSRIYAGFKPGIGPSELREALGQGTVADCLQEFTPTPGQLFFLPAGTVHALGGGVLLAEIQQTSDATFRLFDWNRRDSQGQSRPLHLEESLASIHWNDGPTQPISTIGMPNDRRERLMGCSYFEVEYLHRVSSLALGGVGRLQVLIVTHGQGRFENGEFAMPGDVWVLPATMRAMRFEVEKPISGLVGTLP